MLDRHGAAVAAGIFKSLGYEPLLLDALSRLKASEQPAPPKKEDPK